MGKSVPKGIKSKATIIMKEMPESFNEKFDTNKKAIVALKLPFSKWTTNVMAGFMTRYQKKIIKAKLKEEEAKQKKEAVMKDAPDMAFAKKERKPRVMKEKTEDAAPIAEDAPSAEEAPAVQ
jgi:ribosomal protein S17E